ncbi:glycoside hydrolase family 9 protein [Pseudoxanthomonas sp. 10H]|uniref:glycoside hydrolase family 9 protein n=1 Tax=Pseudoxanthomonas sp. 10H TaxID=3242729 RepID=UPI003557D0EC
MPFRLVRCSLAALFAFACSGDVLAAGAGTPGADGGHARLNQLGFLPGSRMLAVIEGDRARAFEIVSDVDGAVVRRGQSAPPGTWAPAGREASIAELGPLPPGRYRLQGAGMAPSDPFPVDAQAYAALLDASLKAFYFHRAGSPLDAAHAGMHVRAAGHPDTDVEIHASAASPGRPAGTVVSAPGGWYDAGDYNKYVVNSGITMWSLLSAYEHFPQVFRGRDTGIPESGDAVPDLLDEAWWNLRWMLAMQDPGDGGVYHKLTNLRFDGAVMPDQATARRYMVGRSTAAALDFAAVMAMASRVYAGYEARFPGVPARMRAAAESAWRWAQAHPDAVYRQPPDVHTGAYGDARLDDEFAWAAAELFLLTGDAAYWRAFESHAAAPDVPSWANVGALGWISLAAHGGRLPGAAERERVSQAVEGLAGRLAGQWRQSPWRVAMQPEDFVWGSSAMALNQGLVLLQGYRLTRQRDYLDAAQSQLDYVLGRNPLGVSFVTGYGVRTPMHVHHRPSQADGVAEPVPGWLSGGPNPRQQDLGDCKDVTYPSKAPALSWIDHDCSYASNEVAINWNAPLVYVAAGLQALTPP